VTALTKRPFLVAALASDKPKIGMNATAITAINMNAVIRFITLFLSMSLLLYQTMHSHPL
jgi:hypothetical protein